MCRLKFLVLPTLLLAVISCSAVRNVKPVPQGQSAVSVSMGGPLTAVGNANIPLPLVTAGHSYGITPKLSVESGLGITSLLYGIVQLDGGVNYHFTQPKCALPGVFSSGKLFFHTNFKPQSVRVYPALNLGLYWEWQRHLLYTGLDNWIEFSSVRSDGNPQPSHWLPAPYIGYGLTHNNWIFQLETRLYAPNHNNSKRAVSNPGVGENGVFGLFIGASRLFRETGQ